jgi:putative acyl-CoA dehydrogenase
MPDNTQIESTDKAVNQSTPLVGYNLFTTNSVLVEAVEREGAAWASDQLAEIGAYLGTQETNDLANLANRYVPVLRTFDRFGNRIDEVEFHPAWHTLLENCVTHGMHSSPWSDPRSGAHVARAAAFLMQAEIECGVQCPISMTYGSVPTIGKHHEISQLWLPKILTRNYDRNFLPIKKKTGALIGMGMTEKQGGSDVRANTTKAELADNATGEYRLTGHKWFFSAPMCDAFLVTAQAPGGLSCFFVPRWLPDDSLNKIRIQRLKDKLGNRSNASSEVEFHEACGWLVGEAGRGVPTIIDMATYTRLDCALGSAGMMHQAVAQCLNHTKMRSAFGRLLIEQPLMKNVLADLVLESEAATVLIMRIARAFDLQSIKEEEQFRRLATPAAKFWLCKRAIAVGAEAMEVIGGNGYVEEWSMARLYRETPLNSIWEGSGNIMCLDLLRALEKDPEAVEILRTEWRQAQGANVHLDRYIAKLEPDLAKVTAEQASARRFTERIARCLAGALLVRFSPHTISDAFCLSRLSDDWGSTFGTLPDACDFSAIISRGYNLEAEQSLSKGVTVPK